MHAGPFPHRDEANFGVREPSEDVPVGFEVTPELTVVIDLAIKDGPDSFVFVRHRLGAGRGQIDDTQARMDQSSSGHDGFHGRLAPDGAGIAPVV